MFDEMRCRSERVERAREELRTALADLVPICDHRDEQGELHTWTQTHDDFGSSWETYCTYCGEELR